MRRRPSLQHLDPPRIGHRTKLFPLLLIECLDSNTHSFAVNIERVIPRHPAFSEFYSVLTVFLCSRLRNDGLRNRHYSAYPVTSNKKSRGKHQVQCNPTPARLSTGHTGFPREHRNPRWHYPGFFICPGFPREWYHPDPIL
jgi:hypothetical protein